MTTRIALPHGYGLESVGDDYHRLNLDGSMAATISRTNGRWYVRVVGGVEFLAQGDLESAALDAIEELEG